MISNLDATVVMSIQYHIHEERTEKRDTKLLGQTHFCYMLYVVKWPVRYFYFLTYQLWKVVQQLVLGPFNRAV